MHREVRRLSCGKVLERFLKFALFWTASWNISHSELAASGGWGVGNTLLSGLLKAISATQNKITALWMTWPTRDPSLQQHFSSDFLSAGFREGVRHFCTLASEAEFSHLVITFCTNSFHSLWAHIPTLSTMNAIKSRQRKRLTTAQLMHPCNCNSETKL